MNPQIQEELASELYQNGNDFLNHGLRFLLREPGTLRSAKVVVVNLQMSLELLMKWSMVKRLGVQSIYAEDLTTFKDVRTSIWQGGVFTKPFGKLMRSFLAKSAFGCQEKRLLERFQKHRNAIVHSFRHMSFEECTILAADFVFHVIRPLIEQCVWRGPADYLDKDLYGALIRFEPYVDHATRKAQEEASDELTLCWECGNETLDWPGDGSCRCHACGAAGNTDAVCYVDCPSCHSKHSFVYDGLNIEAGPLMGKCLRCQRDSYVAQCLDCGVRVFTEHGQGQMVEGSQWVCRLCFEKRR